MLSTVALANIRIGAALAVTAVAAHSLGAFGDGTPTLATPYPVLLTSLGFLGVPVALIAAAIGCSFALVSWRLDRTAPRLGWRASVALSVVALVSIADFASGWAFGVRYEGLRYVVGCLGISIVAVGALLALLVVNRRTPTLQSALGFYILLFGWAG